MLPVCMVGTTDVFYGQFLSALEFRKTLFNDLFGKVYIGHPRNGRSIACASFLKILVSIPKQTYKMRILCKMFKVHNFLLPFRNINTIMNVK